MNRFRGLVVAAALLASAGAATSIAGGPSEPVAQAELQRAFPGVRLHNDAGRTRVIYGRAMTTAASPREAAEQWLVQVARR